MAAGKWKLFDFAKKNIGEGTILLNDATNLKVALFLSTSNANTLGVGTGVYGDLTNEHANANGYLTGGVAVTGATWNRAAGTLTFDVDNATWTAAGGSIVARFGVLYKNATVNTIIKPLIAVFLLEAVGPADVTTTTGNTLTVTVTNVFTLSGADVD